MNLTQRVTKLELELEVLKKLLFDNNIKPKAQKPKAITTYANRTMTETEKNRF